MLLLVNHFLQRTHCRRKTDLMPTYAPSWEQTSPSPPPLHMGGTHRENEGAGAHVLPAESGQQLILVNNICTLRIHIADWSLHSWLHTVCLYMYTVHSNKLSFYLLYRPCTATKIPLMYSFSGNSAASAPISIFMCL
jgi:hypothetical protein